MIMPFPLPFIVCWAGNHLGVEGTANEDETPVFVLKHGNDRNLVSRAKGYDHLHREGAAAPSAFAMIALEIQFWQSFFL